MVPISKIECIDEYCNAGADELYFGFYDENWNRKYGIFEEINRMSSFGSRANFKIEQIDEVIENIKKNEKKAYLALNSPVYSYAQHNYIKKIMEQNFFRKLDGIIVGDPAILNVMKEMNVSVSLSTMAGVYNSLIVDFYKKFKIDRIILPRDIQIRDIQTIVEKNPDIEFEVFLMRNGCKYSDAYCMSFHGRKYDSMCSCFDKFSQNLCFNSVYSHEFRKEAYSNNKLFTKAFHKETCGLCSISEFYRMGIKSLKIVGRADATERVRQDIRDVRRIIDALDKGKRDVEALYNYDNCLYGLNCYYH